MPTDAPPPSPLGAAQLAAIDGVLGTISRQRAADYAGAPQGGSAKRPTTAPFAAALLAAKAAAAGSGLSAVGFIAEIKRSSPSQGAIAELDPAGAARNYAAGGAAALSVLTEPRHFGGDLLHLDAVAAAVQLPLLRKEFVVHPAQLREAADHGASAALLMVSVLGDATAAYLQYAQALGLEALVEVHDEAELAVALAAGAYVLGVNNRNLKTLQVDLATAPRLIAEARAAGFTGVAVAESGYRTHAEVASVAGVADAVLVGTSLAGSGDLAGALLALRGA